MAIVDITIQERIATAPAGVELVCNNPTDTIRFSFDAEWDAHTARVARFVWEQGYVDIPFTGDTVNVPEITNTLYVEVGVYADSIASTHAKLSCKRSILCLGKEQRTPMNNTDFEQFKAVVEEFAASVAPHEQIDERLTAVENFSPKPFEESGGLVQFEMYQDAPLNVSTRIEPVQAGEGDPSPDNIRPITGHTGATLTHNGTEYQVQFGQTVYGGTLDWSTGVLTVNKAYIAFDGSESWQAIVEDIGARCWLNMPDYSDGVHYVIADRYSTATGYGAHIAAVHTVLQYKASSWSGLRLSFTTGLASLDEWTAYLAAQHAAGTPVQVCYELAEPKTIQLTPQQILALQGLNNISCDVGETTVSGRKDIIWLTHALVERIKTLEEAVISLGGSV